MKNISLSITVCALFSLLFSSCSTTKNSFYFQTLKKDTTLQSVINTQGDCKIRKTDKLLISISSSSREEDVVYNQGALVGGIVYEVNAADGTIQLHKIGLLHAEGMTRKELKDRIQKELAPFLKDPIADVKFANHRVVVIGEVKEVKLVEMPEDKISILEVLAACGDLNPTASRTNITVIRSEGASKQVKKINLEDHSIFNSPWYYLQSEDIVYISPDIEKVQKADRLVKRQQLITTISIVVSVLVIILDRIIR